MAIIILHSHRIACTDSTRIRAHIFPLNLLFNIFAHALFASVLVHISNDVTGYLILFCYRSISMAALSMNRPQVRSKPMLTSYWKTIKYTKPGKLCYPTSRKVS